jgi:hypothetical protein
VAPAGSGVRYEVTAVRYATRLASKSEVVLHFGLYGEPDAELRMEYLFWLARNTSRTILVDCGVNGLSGGCSPPRPRPRTSIRYAGFGFLRGLQADGAHLVAGHDPEVMLRFPPLPAWPAASATPSRPATGWWTRSATSPGAFACTTRARARKVTE